LGRYRLLRPRRSCDPVLSRPIRPSPLRRRGVAAMRSMVRASATLITEPYTAGSIGIPASSAPTTIMGPTAGRATSTGATRRSRQTSSMDTGRRYQTPFRPRLRYPELLASGRPRPRTPPSSLSGPSWVGGAAPKLIARRPQSMRPRARLSSRSRQPTGSRSSAVVARQSGCGCVGHVEALRYPDPGSPCAGLPRRHVLPDVEHPNPLSRLIKNAAHQEHRMRIPRVL
jgi:hypothetical protein